jgi:chromosome segregation ATPase|eukprot:COSAG02_NODE_28_length_51367_cov_70.053932_17_plen_151_part_00
MFAAAQDGVSLTSAKANQAELSTVQLRGELANARSEAGYMKNRVRELDDELAAASFHLASVQDENATLLEECERLRAANKAARVDAGRSVATERTLQDAARRAWEDHAADGPPAPATLDNGKSRRRSHGRADDRRYLHEQPRHLHEPPQR